MAGRKFLIYSQDKIISAALTEQLVAMPDTAAVNTAESQQTALAEVQNVFYDAVIINEDISFCRLLYDNDFRRPIFLLGSAEQDETYSFVSECFVKPFKINTFTDRLYKVLLEYENQETQSFTFGNYIFIPLKRTLQNTATGKEIKLTEKEAYILIYLYRAGGEPIERNKLLEEIWGYNPQITTHTLETHIYRLRQKIESNNDKVPIIISDEGGYRLNPQVL